MGKAPSILFFISIFSGLSFLAPQLFTPTAQATVLLDSPWKVQVLPKDGGVEFTAIGRPSALKIRGKGEGPSGNLAVDSTLTSVSGTLSVSLESLDTGISTRNQHMKEKYLETARYPHAAITFNGTKFAGSVGQKSYTLRAVPLEAKLLLHGVEKPIQVLADLQRNENQLQVDAEFKLNLDDFKISTPTFAGITMAKEVKVRVHFSAEILPIQPSESLLRPKPKPKQEGKK